MATSTKSSRHGVPETGRPWSIERPGIELPDQATALPTAALILVVTDDGRSEWSARNTRVAIDLARSIGARILFYDRSAESHFVDGYASGPWTAATEWSHGERMLEPRELHAMGREYLAAKVAQAGAAGVPAWAWLPHSVGRASIAEAVDRFGVDLVVVPGELRHTLGEPRGRFWERHAELRAPVLVAAADGSLRDWQLATELSRVEFVARQFGLLVVRGHFSDFEVRLDFDEAHPASTRLEARILARSVTTGVGIRDRDLRGPSFFDVERYPYLTFMSTAVEGSGSAYRIRGELEIKGRRRDVELNGEFHGVGAANGYRRATMSATAKIDWRDWGLSGRPFIDNAVTLSIHAVAVRASAEGS